MELREVKRLAKLARDAGLQVEELDYGWTVHAWRPGDKKVLIISEVFRAERDGYVGGRTICEDVLLEWIKANPPSKSA